MSESGQMKKLEELASLRTERVVGRKEPFKPYVGLEHMASDDPSLLAVGRSDSSVSINSIFYKGDVLFGKLRPNLRKSLSAPFDGYCSTDILVLQPVAGCDPGFVARVFQREEVFAEAVRTSEGTKMPRTSWSRLRGYAIFSPEDDSDRQAITRILDTVDKGVTKTEILIAKLKAIKQGLLHDLLTRGLDANNELRQWSNGLPKGWEEDALYHYVPVAEYGISTSLSERGEVPVLRMQNISEGAVDLGDLKYASCVAVAGRLLCDGDVLFNRTNSIEHVGRTGIWRGELSPASFASYLVRLVPDKSRLLPEYLNLWLNWPETQRRIRRFATTGVQQVNINPTNLRTETIRLPKDILEQQRIVNVYAAADSRIRSEGLVLAKLKAIKKGLMQDLLSGRVHVQSGTIPASATG